jgi:hypothetical protein
MTTESNIWSIYLVCFSMIGALLGAAALSAVKFQEAQDSIEHRTQIGKALMDSHVAASRTRATDRERPAAAAIADAVVGDELAAAEAKPASNRRHRGVFSRRYPVRDRLAHGGW